MKKPLLICGLTLIACAPLMAGQVEYKDIRISRDMMPPAKRSDAQAQAKAQFQMLDSNKDGAVTRDEMAARRAAQMKEMQDAMFARLDADKDGTISRAEFDAHHAGMMAHGPHDAMPHMAPPQAPAAPPAADAPHAGHGAAPAKHVVIIRRDMHGGPDGMMDGSWIMDLADADKDGRLTEAEVTAAALARFDRLDRNKDGEVSAQERRAGWRKTRETIRLKSES